MFLGSKDKTLNVAIRKLRKGEFSFLDFLKCMFSQMEPINIHIKVSFKDGTEIEADIKNTRLDERPD